MTAKHKPHFLAIPGSVILRADGGKGTIGALTLGPADLGDLKTVAHGIDPSYVFVDWEHGGRGYYGFYCKSASRNVDAALTSLFRRLNLSWANRQVFSDNNGGIFVLNCDSRIQGHTLAAATQALIKLGLEVENAPEQTYTTQPAYYGTNTGHAYTCQGSYSGQTVIVTYVVPFDMDAYIADRKRLIAESSENLNIANQDNQAANLNNQTSILDADTERNVQATTTGRTLRYAGIAAIVLLALGAIVALVKRHKK